MSLNIQLQTFLFGKQPNRFFFPPISVPPFYPGYQISVISTRSKISSCRYASVVHNESPGTALLPGRPRPWRTASRLRGRSLGSRREPVSVSVSGCAFAAAGSITRNGFRLERFFGTTGSRTRSSCSGTIERKTKDEGGGGGERERQLTRAINPNQLPFKLLCHDLNADVWERRWRNTAAAEECKPAHHACWGGGVVGIYVGILSMIIKYDTMYMVINVSLSFMLL